jgi:glycosyltransferase involved in cell wall biosynthesis
MRKLFRAVAIVCLRNEELYVRRCLESLLAEGLEVFVIDHASSDRTVEIAGEYVGRGVIDVQPLPFGGHYALAEVLRAKRAVLGRLPHDWVVHVDADEWLQARAAEPLCDLLARADRAGCNCVNFDEFVFVPVGEEDFRGRPHHLEMRWYYFFEPMPARLLRAWKRTAGLSNHASGGHTLTGETRVWPISQNMLHYVCLSRLHFEDKYLRRQYPAEELARDWHRNREVIKGGFRWPTDRQGLLHLPVGDPKGFDRTAPRAQHFWEW